MRRHLSSFRGAALAALSLLALAPAGVLAAGFGTPTVDGSLTGDTAAYGAAEASDPVDPPQGFAHLDLGDLYVCNDNDYWYFYYTINGDIGATNWGKYILYIDTTNDANGATVDAWGRSVTVTDPHKPEYSMNSWVDQLPYDGTRVQFFEWTGAAWNQNGGADDGALVAGATSAIEWKVARTRIGDPATIWVEVYSTGGGAADPAQDTVNDPADDWNGADWSTPSIVLCSTEVARSAGSDVTPPVVTSGCVRDGFDTIIDLTFSEKVSTATAENIANYALTGGKTVVSATLAADSAGVALTIDTAYGFGSCQQVLVTGVQDLAANTIVNDGTTNVSNFYRFEIYVKGRMNIYMRTNSVPPDTFAVEGNLAPLTWDPTCDDLLSDVDADSIYTGTFDFCLPCSTASSGGVVQNLDYKFTHNCVNWESTGNHFYEIDPSVQTDGVDTLDIWWEDQAPTDFTTLDIDVLFFVRSFNNNPPFGASDSLGLDGSELPLNWNNPPDLLMLDDGIAPDDAAGDGIYSSRVTFPAGTLENVQFKFTHKGAVDTTFSFECTDAGNRNVFLDDTIYSTANPLALPLAYFDDCAWSTGVDAISGGALDVVALEASHPNPARETTTIGYAIPSETHVRLEIFDVSGRRVRTLVDEVRPAGRHQVMWNGRTAEGRALTSGVYFSRIEVDGVSRTGKILLMR